MAASKKTTKPEKVNNTQPGYPDKMSGEGLGCDVADTAAPSAATDLTVAKWKAARQVIVEEAAKQEAKMEARGLRGQLIASATTLVTSTNNTGDTKLANAAATFLLDLFEPKAKNEVSPTDHATAMPEDAETP